MQIIGFDWHDVAAAAAIMLGAIMVAISAKDGSKLAEYKLDVLPAWDGMAAGYGKLFVVNQDGGVECWGKKP